MASKLILSENDLRYMRDILMQEKFIAVDTEATGLHLLKSRIMMITVSTSDHDFIIPIRLLTQQNADILLVRKYLGPVLYSKKICKYFYNTKYDRHMFANDRLRIRNTRDVMVMGWLLDENRPKTLKDRCTDVGMQLSKFKFNEYFKLRARYARSADNMMEPAGTKPKVRDFGSRDDYNTAMTQWEEHRSTYAAWKKEVKPLSPGALVKFHALEEEMLSYAAEDSQATFKLGHLYENKLRTTEPRIWNVFLRLWNPYLITLYRMERRGQRLDLKYLKVMQKQCLEKIAECEKIVYSTARKVFKIGSGAELGHLLFNVMKCPVISISRKTGKPSTDATTLELLSRFPEDDRHPYGTEKFKPKYPLAKAVLDWRNYSKLWSTYMGPNSSLLRGLVGDMIYPTFNACGTDTGRLSSQNPNGQNLPRSAEDNFFFRKLFIPPRGYGYFIADQSQVELRVVADLSGDPKLCEAYINDEDIHTKTAVGCGLDPQEDRPVAKNLNFGAIYGIGDEKFATMLTVKTGKYVSPEQGEQYLSAFFLLYEKIPEYQHRCGVLAKKHGFVTTYLCRKRRLPDIYSSKFYEVARATRQAGNARVQGGVADIMTCGMFRFDNDPWMRKNRCYLISQVHDEIHVIAPLTVDFAELTKRTKAIFEQPFEDKYKFRVPLKLSCPKQLSKDWHSAK